MRRLPGKSGKWSDHYTQKAKKENFPARSVYKLQEIQRRYRLIRSGDRILDLGCYPGSWLLYAAEKVGARGQVVGVDIKKMDRPLPDNVRVLTGDVLDAEAMAATGMDVGFSGVLSDMAPSTTGIRHVDSARSFGLCEAAFALAESVLVPGGFFVCKIFQGSEFQSFSQSVRRRFRQYNVFKPKSSRKASSEIYIIGRGLEKH